MLSRRPEIKSRFSGSWCCEMRLKSCLRVRMELYGSGCHDGNGSWLRLQVSKNASLSSI